MKTRVEELTDEQLDHFCAIAQKWKRISNHANPYYIKANGTQIFCDNYHPTTNAAQCMAIQEREKISVNWEYDAWEAEKDNYEEPHNDFMATGSTAKRAIIACFVKSKLGEEVDCETI